MPKLIFHPDIQYEIRESYQWYESRAHGLGEDFIAELESAFQSIKDIPETWPLIAMDFRRFLLNRFPFGVIYQIKQDEIYVPSCI
jgi:toxin ParE1/3/4